MILARLGRSILSKRKRVLLRSRHSLSFLSAHPWEKPRGQELIAGNCELPGLILPLTRPSSLWQGVALRVACMHRQEATAVARPAKARSSGISIIAIAESELLPGPYEAFEAKERHLWHWPWGDPDKDHFQVGVTGVVDEAGDIAGKACIDIDVPGVERPFSLALPLGGCLSAPRHTRTRTPLPLRPCLNSYQTSSLSETQALKAHPCGWEPTRKRPTLCPASC